MENLTSVQLTRAIMLDGKPKKVGSVIKVTEIFARELIQMNKAVRSKAAPEKEEEPVKDPEKETKKKS